MPRQSHVLTWLVGLLFSARLMADAIVTSQAMSATTIAEFFIQPGELRVELEIGLQDLPAFRNLMPDGVYEKMGHSPKPLQERLVTFFAEDLVIATETGSLSGALLEIGPRTRIRRDPITGEELAVAAEDEETVVSAVLSYSMEGEPGELVLSPPRSNPPPNIGFVVYHNRVAVNDFRYLGQPLRLLLDWEDSWYSKFEQRALRRSYFAPMSGFLYVEPFEVRKEIIVRPKDMQRWVDLGLEGSSVISADQRGAVLEKISGFLQQRQPVTINGELAEPILDRANFLSRTLRNSMVVEPGIDVHLDSAIVGVIFIYPVPDLPDKATMTWDMFDERILQVPAASVDEAGPFETLLDPDRATLKWENVIRNPSIHGLVDLPAPSTALSQWLYTLRWWALGLVVISLTLWARSQGRLTALAAVSGLVVLGLSLVLGKPLVPPPAVTGQVVGDLLRNVYQAFDHPRESDIYDTLARSVSGDLLTDIYLETRRSLELASQGGARAKVKSVDVQALDVQEGDVDQGFRADVTWNVSGAVGHWGHVHTRNNQYQAELEVRVVDGRWKLTDMNVLQEQRL